MPQFVIEASKELVEEVSGRALVDAVFAASENSELFESEDIKVRLLPCSYYCLGSGHAGFVHVTGKIMPGRTQEQQQALATGVAQALSDLNLLNQVVTVEVVEINKAAYAKRL